MKKKNILLVILVCFGLVFGVLYFFKKPKEILITSDRSITSLKPTNLINTPTESYKIRFSDKFLYTLDFDSNQIYKFALDGRIQQTLSAGKAKRLDSPLIIDFDIDSSGNVMVADAKNHRFIKIDREQNLTFESSPERFTRAKFIGSDQFLCKSFDKSFKNDNVLILGKNQDKVIDGILPIYNDGGMATDGFFVNNNKSYAHVSYHMGDIIVWDKTTDKATRFKTLDSYNIKPEVLDEGHGRFTLKGDSKTINICGGANDDNLYILSNVRAKNETHSDFTENNVIDVYSIAKRKYVKSYYLPRIDGERITDFVIKNHTLYSVQGKKIAIYDLI